MKKFANLFLTLPIAAMPTWASAGEGINWWHFGAAYKDAPALGWLSLTFLLFIALLLKAISKPLGLYLETRSKDIRKAIEEGARIKKESEEQLASYEARLSSLSDEIEAMKKQFQEQAESDRKEKMRLTKELEIRIMKDAEDTIKADFTRSRNRLAEQVVEQALRKTQEAILASNLNEVDGYLKKQLIFDLGNKGGEVKQ